MKSFLKLRCRLARWLYPQVFMRLKSMENTVENYRKMTVMEFEIDKFNNEMSRRVAMAMYGVER